MYLIEGDILRGKARATGEARPPGVVRPSFHSSIDQQQLPEWRRRLFWLMRLDLGHGEGRGNENTAFSLRTLNHSDTQDTLGADMSMSDGICVYVLKCLFIQQPLPRFYRCPSTRKHETAINFMRRKDSRGKIFPSERETG